MAQNRGNEVEALKPTLDLLKRFGAEPNYRKSGHIMWIFPDGRKFLTSKPGRATDQKAWAHNLTILRRLIRENNMKPVKKERPLSQDYIPEHLLYKKVPQDNPTPAPALRVLPRVPIQHPTICEREAGLDRYAGVRIWTPAEIVLGDMIFQAAGMEALRQFIQYRKTYNPQQEPAMKEALAAIQTQIDTVGLEVKECDRVIEAAMQAEDRKKELLKLQEALTASKESITSASEKLVGKPFTLGPKKVQSVRGPYNKAIPNGANEKLLSFMRTQAIPVTTVEVASGTGLEHKQAFQAISYAIKKGNIQKIGSGRGAKYLAKPSAFESPTNGVDQQHAATA